MQLKGQTAVVTGASSGLGEAFARNLAARGANLILVARRKERLEGLKDQLTQEHGILASVIALDLSREGAGTELFELTEGKGTPVDILVNNAGFGTQSAFLDIPWERTAEQLRLNMTAVTETTYRFGRAMRERKRGWILNVSSVGAYSPSPDYAAYSASKAYVRDFTEAVGYELRNSGVRLCSLCPGLTRTEFHQVAGHELKGLMAMTVMSAGRCAEIGLRALFAGRRNVIAGLVNKLSMFLLRFLPRRTIVASAKMLAGRR